MWNKFWFCKIRMGYCHVLCFMSVSYFSSLTETRDVWPSEWHSQLWRAGQLPPWDGDRHHIYCPVYPGTHYYHKLSQLQSKYTNSRNKCDLYLPWFYRQGPRSAPAAACRSPPASASWADLTWGSWRRSPWPGGCRPCCAWCPWPARDTCKWKMFVWILRQDSRHHCSSIRCMIVWDKTHINKLSTSAWP